MKTVYLTAEKLIPGKSCYLTKPANLLKYLPLSSEVVQAHSKTTYNYQATVPVTATINTKHAPQSYQLPPQGGGSASLPTTNMQPTHNKQGQASHRQRMQG